MGNLLTAFCRLEAVQPVSPPHCSVAPGALKSSLEHNLRWFPPTSDSEGQVA